MLEPQEEYMLASAGASTLREILFGEQSDIVSEV
jgi:hypothetical protein